MNIPMKPGYYWAKWRIASDGTNEGHLQTPSDTWEIVQVNENRFDWADNPAEDEALSVAVPGVGNSQWRDCFVWGEFVAPLEKPPAGSRGERIRKLLDTKGFRGALGEFPEGRLTKHDEGAIQFAIGAQDGKVVLDFGTPVCWVGMSPQQAADLASSLLSKAREASRRNGEPLVITIR